MPVSQTFIPVSETLDFASQYSMPEVYVVTSTAVLYRVRKAGKFFIIKTPKDNSGHSLAMLQREYELSIGKSHPHVVNVFTYEASTVVGPGIVMEYVSGRNLTEFIAEKPSLSERRRVFKQLLHAVHYLHCCGVVHNDIKPENILITHAGNDVKLIDFGLADDDAHFLARTLGCTPEYASPELLAKNGDIDVRSDIYSLGVVMKELFGKYCSRISARCTNADKEKRYSNAEALLDAFKHRNRPWMIALAVILAIPLILLQFGYVNSFIKEDRAIAERDALQQQVEEDVKIIYQATVDSIAKAFYCEFAHNDILVFYETVVECRNDRLATITDPELASALELQYMQKLNSFQEALWLRANALPSFRKSGLSQSEILYYDSLVLNRLPYQSLPIKADDRK